MDHDARPPAPDTGRNGQSALSGSRTTARDLTIAQKFVFGCACIMDHFHRWKFAILASCADTAPPRYDDDDYLSDSSSWSSSSSESSYMDLDGGTLEYPTPVLYAVEAEP